MNTNHVINVGTLAHYDEKIKAFVKAINDLTNYYNKSNSYNKTEVDNFISAIAQFRPQITTENPATKIAQASDVGKFLLYKPEGKSHYEEWVGIDLGASATPQYKFELIGDTDIKLENYFTKAETTSAIATAKSEAVASAKTYADATFATQTALNTETAAREALETEFDSEIGGVKNRLNTAEGDIDALEANQLKVNSDLNIGKTNNNEIYVKNDSIGTSNIVNNAITSAKIENGAVTADKIDAGSFSSGLEMITPTGGDKSIQVKLASDSGLDFSNGGLQIATSGVTTARIKDSAVITDKINDGAVTNDKVSSTAALSNGQLATASTSVKGAVKVGSGLQMTGTSSDVLGVEVSETGGLEIKSSTDDMAPGLAIKVDSSNTNGLSIGTSGIKMAVATTSAAGAMSSADKTKLDGIATEANKGVTTITGGAGITVTGGTTTSATIAVSSNAGLQDSQLATASDSVKGAIKTGGVFSVDTNGKLQLGIDQPLTINTTDNVLTVDNLGITSDYLAESAVTTNKISAGAVTAAKIADDAVTNAKIADNAALSDGQLATASNSTKGAVKVQPITSGLWVDSDNLKLKLASDSGLDITSGSTGGLSIVFATNSDIDGLFDPAA